MVASDTSRTPSVWMAIVPIVILVALLAVSIRVFGTDTLNGASQMCLLFASASCVAIAMLGYKIPWSEFSRSIGHVIGHTSEPILILLTIGMLSGAWMISGVIPTLIYYGVQIMSPRFFLVCTCIICSLVSLLTGTSWTTVATIGVALMGVARVLGIDVCWTAGAIISGAYFGDKMSPLSDTTILASSCARTGLFDHIHYMLYTTVPSMGLTLLVFFVAGLCMPMSGQASISSCTEGLAQSFHITAWTMVIPVLTAILIVRKVPSLVVLFLSALAGLACALVLQPHVLLQVAQADVADFMSMTKGAMTTLFGSTSVETGSDMLNKLVETSGMAGMLNTVWLILCALTFGGCMVASRMLGSITQAFMRNMKGVFGLVASTVGTGLVMNICTGDQYLSITLTADMYREAYKQLGYEPRLLSRTTEDAVTVTSVLIPWNTCGMTQSSLLGVATMAYWPYCIFNYLSPVTTLVVAALKWRIKRIKTENK